MLLLVRTGNFATWNVYCFILADFVLIRRGVGEDAFFLRPSGSHCYIAQVWVALTELPCFRVLCTVGRLPCLRLHLPLFVDTVCIQHVTFKVSRRIYAKSYERGHPEVR